MTDPIEQHPRAGHRDVVAGTRAGTHPQGEDDSDAPTTSVTTSSTRAPAHTSPSSSVRRKGCGHSCATPRKWSAQRRHGRLSTPARQVAAAAAQAGLIDGNDLFLAHPDPDEFLDEQFREVVGDRVAEATKELLGAQAVPRAAGRHAANVKGRLRV